MRMKLLAWMVLAALTGVALAQQSGAPIEKRELIYCADLMTHEEREAYRAKMQAARSLDEKTQIRADHRTAMQARAVSLGRAGECEPQAQGPGLGQGAGQGIGQGAGQGLQGLGTGRGGLRQ